MNRVIIFTVFAAEALRSSAFTVHKAIPESRLCSYGRWRGSQTLHSRGAPLRSAEVDVLQLLSSSNMLLSESSADYSFQGSYASLYATLGLYLLSFPGLISLVKRATKKDIKQKTYTLAGPAAEDAKSMRQVAAEIMAYFQANNYKVDEAGEVIVFKGVTQQSTSQAFFLSFCTLIGLGSLSLVLQIQVPQVGAYWWLMCLGSPYAGVYYWQNAQQDDEIRVRLQATDDEKECEVTIQGDKEQLERFQQTLQYNEKGMIRVKGIFE